MVIDRIEGRFALVENFGEMIDIPLCQLPENVREGDILKIENGEYIVDNTSAIERKEKLFSRLENILNKE